MKRIKPEQLGSEPIGSLLIRQSLPASVGILAMSLNYLIDTIFVGHWIGPLAIAAITIVTPIIFLISSIGMAIGVGGSSIISRALGKGNSQKACKTFGNQIVITTVLVTLFILVSTFFKLQTLQLFGAAGSITAPASIYFTVTLWSVPCVAFAMTSNPVIRAEGNSKVAMVVLLVPSMVNLLLDVIFIRLLHWGIGGAAWATAISYFGSALYILYYFMSGQSIIRIKRSYLKPDWRLIGEIASLGLVTLARQSVVSILAIVVNNTLYAYGQEAAVTSYGIISRLMMFALFPVLGITQGFLPIAGYNYGAEKYKRVKQTIKRAALYSTLLALLVFIIIVAFPKALVQIFTTDQQVIEQTSYALRWVFAATPIVGIELIGSAYFQAIGRAVKALLLTSLRQGFFLIPLIYGLARIWGIDGVWYAFPIADLLSVMVISVYLYVEIRKRLS